MHSRDALAQLSARWSHLHFCGETRSPLTSIAACKTSTICLYAWRRGFQDALYTGSIRSLKEYQKAGDHETYISSVTHVPQGDGEAEENTSCMAPVLSVISQMFDFSLLKSMTFILISGAGVLCFLGTFSSLLAFRVVQSVASGRGPRAFVYRVQCAVRSRVLFACSRLLLRVAVPWMLIPNGIFCIPCKKKYSDD